ncbi:MAG: hypothetical protein JWM71_122 [Solirubrobacteraceae bacterium]|nr:hypothetical protein [Solirubrobacteraceae bacterium]
MNSAELTRRRALMLGAGTAGAFLAPGTSLAAPRRAHTAVRKQHGTLPAKEIQKIVGAEGTVSSGVLGIGIDREDIGKVKGPQGVTFTPSFEISGDLTFQPLGSGRAFFNGDLALKASELNRVIDAILANNLVFQAMHQHYFGLDPMVWFVHFHGQGDPLELAEAVRNVLDATATPLPQKSPAHPKTPLDHARLAHILHGTSEIGSGGVVTVTVNRRGSIRIGDVEVSPEANISTNISFLPLNHAGTRAAAAPDFSMTATEVDGVCRTMRAEGFEIGCLYNQETYEHPQLYFAHMLNTGDPVALATAIRRGLDHTHAD